MPGFPKEAWKATTLPGEDPEKSPKEDPLKAMRDSNAIQARLIQKWKECMFSKGYVWNWNPLEPDK
jgi:hypothetical protein